MSAAHADIVKAEAASSDRASALEKQLREVEDKTSAAIAAATTSSDTEIAKLQKQLADIDAEKATLTAKVSAAEKELEDVRKASTTSADKEASLHEELAALKKGLEDEKAEHEARLAQAQETATMSLKAELEALQTKLGDLEKKHATELDTLRAEATKTQEAHAAELEKLRATHAESQKAAQTTPKDNKALKASKKQLASSQAELAKSQKAVADSETTITKLSERIEKLELDLAKASSNSPPVTASEEVASLKKELESRNDELEGMNLVRRSKVASLLQMLEMNRNEFEKAMTDIKSDHATALSKQAETLRVLQDELKAERAEKTSALQQVRQLSAGSAPAGDSPRTKQVAQLESTIAQLREQYARRDLVEAPNVPTDVRALQWTR